MARARAWERRAVAARASQRAPAGRPPPVLTLESPAAVEAWFRAEAKTDPTLLEGSGLDAEDIGVFHKNSLEKCSGVRYAYHNLGNMVLLPRVDVVLMKAAGLG